MNRTAPPRGGAPVGMIEELSAIEAGAVHCLRRWSDGPAAQADIRYDFAATLGKDAGQEALDAFEGMFTLCARYGRRPLMRHSVSCKCLGADESCFANFVGYASEGAREDAFLIAATMVRPDMAGALVGLAEEFGLALRRISLKAGFGMSHSSQAGRAFH